MASKREQRRKARKIRRKRREQRRNARPTGPPIPIPDTLEEFADQYCAWPHIENRRRPVYGLSPIQRLYFAGRTCFRYDTNGDRIYGADIIGGKPRRCFITTAGLDGTLYSMVRSSVRCMMTVHTESKDVSGEMRRQVMFAAQRLPEEWTGGVKQVGGVIEFKKTGSIWLCVTAGSSEDIASSVVGSTVDVLHMTEVKQYRYPEALFGAAKEAVPTTTGSILCESTFPTLKCHWHYQQYLASKESAGSFLRAFFWPWMDDPRKVLAADHPEYSQVMSPAFVATMDEVDLAAEDRLGLTDEQRAWRRSHYCRGGARDRRLARIENPEDDETIFVSLHEPWLDAGALDTLDAGTRPPTERVRLAEKLIGEIWDSTTEPILIAVDTAEFGGRDYKAAVAVGTHTIGVVGVVHGKSLESDFAEAIVWLIEQTIGSSRGRGYTVCVERNRDTGLIQELKRRGVRLWSERGQKRPGFLTTRRTRPILLDRIVEAIEGPDENDDGTPRKLGPVRVIPSAELAMELRGLQDIDGKIQAGKGAHDDLAIAYAIALFVAPSLKIRRGASTRRVSTADTARPDYAAQLAAIDRGGGPS